MSGLAILRQCAWWIEKEMVIPFSGSGNHYTTDLSYVVLYGRCNVRLNDDWTPPWLAHVSL